MIRAAACLDARLRTYQGQHAAAQVLLQHALGDGFGLPGPDLVHDSCGRPAVAAHPEVHVSVSHCEGAVLVAASSARIGVDVEWLRPLDRFALARMLNPAEIDRVLRSPDPDREFFRYWTLKESYLKAVGTGLGYAVKDLDVDVAPDGTASVSRRRAWVGLDERFEGYVLAFCSLDSGPGDTDVALERRELTRL